MSIACKNCSRAVTDDSSFCEGCGTRLSQVATTSTTDDTAPPPSTAPPPPASTWNFGDVNRTITPPANRAQSRAWIYYAILTVLSLISVIAGHPVGLVGVVLFGAYATYIYRGGRIIFWFW